MSQFLRRLLWPSLFYLLAALLITYPLITVFSSHVAGAEYGDSFEYLRLAWWARHALANGENPFFQGLLAYPNGFSSASQLAQPLIYLPAALLGIVFGDIVAFNLWVLFILVVSGLSAYWLCRVVLTQETGQTGVALTCAALLGGLVFMAFPAMQGHLKGGHINPLSNYALPLVMLSFYCMWRGVGNLWRWAVIGGVAVWVLLLGNFTAAVYALLPILLFAGGYCLLRKSLRWRALLASGLCLSLAAVLSLPFYGPLLSEALAADRPSYLDIGGTITYSTDPLAFLAPSHYTPWGRALAPAYGRAVLGTNSTEGAAYLGILGWLGLAYLLWKKPKGVGLWAALLLGAAALSLGPLLKWADQPLNLNVGGQSTGIVLPYALLENLPLVNVTRTPGRFNITTGLALAVLLALAAAKLLQSLRGPRQQRAAFVFASLFLLTDYQLFFPLPATPATAPAYLTELRQRQDLRAAFDVPYEDRLAQKNGLLYQVYHQKPLLGGYVSRESPVPPAKLTILSEAALGRLPTLDAAQRVALLRAHGVDILLVHTQLLSPNVLDELTVAYGEAAYADANLRVYDLSAMAAGQKPRLVVYQPSGQWQNQPGPQWLGQQSDLYLYVAKPSDVILRVALNPFTKPQNLDFLLNGQRIRAWQVTRAGQLEFGLSLPTGFHHVGFRFATPCTLTPILGGPEGAIALAQPACVNALLGGWNLTLSDSDAAPLSPFRAVTGNLDGIDLTGVRAPSQAIAGQPIWVETAWKAQRQLGGDYHLFVQVLNGSGQLVAQWDGVPGNGAASTETWSADQVWLETAYIDLPAGLAAGTYQLYAGWYRYPDIARLAGGQEGLLFLGALEVLPP
jgi:hypothetical protein